jgi:hypothetical protein
VESKLSFTGFSGIFFTAVCLKLCVAITEKYKILKIKQSRTLKGFYCSDQEFAKTYFKIINVAHKLNFVTE